MRTELDKFYELIDDLEIAMMTTRRRTAPGVASDGQPEASRRCRPVVRDRRMRSRTARLESDPHVTSRYKDRTREWISVSAIATISRDRQKIRELYAPEWRMWFPDEGDPRHGTAGRSAFRLDRVNVHARSSWKWINRNRWSSLKGQGVADRHRAEIGKMHTSRSRHRRYPLQNLAGEKRCRRSRASFVLTKATRRRCRAPGTLERDG